MPICERYKEFEFAVELINYRSTEILFSNRQNDLATCIVLPLDIASRPNGGATAHTLNSRPLSVVDERPDTPRLRDVSTRFRCTVDRGQRHVKMTNE